MENLAGAHTETFPEHLAAQLRQSQLLKPGSFLRLCLYLTDCLDERGYLTIPLEELAVEQGCSKAEAEQALFALQMLDPPGVGARDLTECLILQLAQGPDFNALTVRMARDGLEALAAKDYAKLSRKFHASEAEIRRAAAVLTALNPIPAAGFGTAAPPQYAVPDAVVHVEGETVVMELNERALPRLTVNRNYAAALQESGDNSVRTYVREKLTEANALSGALQARRDTLTALLAALADLQGDYFRSGTLRPLAMGEDGRAAGRQRIYGKPRCQREAGGVPRTKYSAQDPLHGCLDGRWLCCGRNCAAKARMVRIAGGPSGAVVRRSAAACTQCRRTQCFPTNRGKIPCAARHRRRKSAPLQIAFDFSAFSGTLQSRPARNCPPGKPGGQFCTGEAKNILRRFLFVGRTYALRQLRPR